MIFHNRRKSLNELNRSNRDVQIVILGLGGQEIYHEVHLCF